MKYETFSDFEQAVRAQHGEYDLRNQWVTGGQGGGSCWDEGPANHYGIEAEEEPDQEVLDDILDDAFPDLTFREYRVLQKAEVFEYVNKTQNEYYGNYTRYRIRTLDLRKLYNALRDISEDRG